MVFVQIRWALALVAAVVCSWASPTPVAAQQQVTVTVPQQVLSDSFYERFGIGWGFRSRPPGGNGGFFFNNGGFGGAIPPFGGFDPNAGANFGFGIGGPNGSLNFNFAANSGSSRSMTTVAPMITLPNGGFGSIQSGAIRPFVTGIVPVVGAGGGAPITATNPLTERLRRLQSGEQTGPRYSPDPAQKNSRADEATAVSGEEASGGASASNDAPESTAQRGELSVKELRRQRAQAERAAAAEIAELVAKGAAAEAEGKPSIARIYFQQAQRRATGDEARELAARIQRLK